MIKKIDERFLKLYPVPRKFYCGIMFRKKRWCKWL